MTKPHVVTTTPLRPGSVPASALAGVLVGSGPGGRIERAEAVVLAYEVAAGDVVADAAGDAELRFGPPPAGHMWLLEAMVVHVAGSPGSSCSVYVGQARSIDLVAGTTKGDLDTADQDPPIYVPGGSEVLVVWAGAELAGVGQTCTARLQYRVARLEAG